MEENRVLKMVKGGFNYANLSQQEQDNKEIALMSLKFDADNIKLMNESLKDDKDIALQAILDGHYLNFGQISDNLKKDCEFVLTILSYYNAKDYPGSSYSIYPHVAKNLRSDKEIALLAIKGNNACYKYVAPELKNDEDIVYELAKNGRYFKDAPQEFKKDKRFILQVLNVKREDNILVSDNIYEFIKNIDFSLRDDEEIMLSAMKRNSVFSLCSDRLKNDKNFIIEVLKENKAVMFELSKELKNDPDVKQAYEQTQFK